MFAGYHRSVDAICERERTSALGAMAASDRCLVEWALEGRREAWTRLHRRHRSNLRDRVSRLTRDSLAADELTDEALAVAFCEIDRFRGESSFATWLYGIAQNLARRQWRKAERDGRALEDLRFGAQAHPRVFDSPELVLTRHREARILREALRDLSPALREAFVLREVEGLAPDAVADRLGISTNNVNVRATRARAQLREALTDYQSSDLESPGR